MSTLDHYNYVSRQVTQELDCRNVTTYSLQGVFRSLDFLYFFNWHLNTCDANYSKKLIWTLVNMHIHSHLVTSPEKNHILHPRFLPQKQSWLLASCRNLRKTKETAFPWFTQGQLHHDPFTRWRSPVWRECRSLHLWEGRDLLLKSWAAGYTLCRGTWLLRLSAATLVSVIHQKLKMPWHQY